MEGGSQRIEMFGQKRQTLVGKDNREKVTATFETVTTISNHTNKFMMGFATALPILRLLSSGFVEGLNNKIKVIKRRGSGILNIKHF
jgi:Transposase and inactivated derivatives